MLSIGHDLENIVSHITQDAALRSFGIFGISLTSPFSTTVQISTFTELVERVCIWWVAYILSYLRKLDALVSW